MKILLTGGGTMGSVTSLLAVVEELKTVEPTTEFFWLGTKDGPEKKIIKEYGINFQAIYGGKLRRYFSFKNFIDPFKILVGFFQSLSYLRKIKPDIILTAGAFISVPVIWAGWILRIPSIVHQQDIISGLANKLMAPFSKKITVTFEQSLKYYSKKKIRWIGNPVRESMLRGNKARAVKNFALAENLPTVLVVGGGTGALALNQALVEGLNELVKFCQLIHISGSVAERIPEVKELARYHHYQFLTEEMKDVLAVADIVVSRAGMGFLTELAAWGKAVILIPIKDSHQEVNANYFAKSNAAIVLSQEELDSESLVRAIKNLLDNKSDKANLEKNIQMVMKWGAVGEMVEVVREITSK